MQEDRAELFRYQYSKMDTPANMFNIIIQGLIYNWDRSLEHPLMLSIKYSDQIKSWPWKAKTMLAVTQR